MSSPSQIPGAMFLPQFTTPGQGAQQKLTLQQMAGANTIQKQVQQENDVRLREDALKLQAQQEDQNDQETLQGAFGDPANIKPDGTVDYDKVRATVAPKLRIRNLQNLDKEHIALLQGTAAMDAAKRAKLQAQNQSVGNELMGVVQSPEESRQASWAGSRQRLIQQGDIKPDDPEWPEQVPDDKTVKSLMGKHGYAAALQSLATAQAEEQRKKEVAVRAEAQAAKAQAESDAKEAQQRIEEAARDFLKVTDQASMDEWLDSLDINTRKRMPKRFDPKTTPKIVNNMALTSQQRDQGIDRDIRAKADADRAAVSGGKPGLAARAHDPTATYEERKAAADALDDLEKRETKQSDAKAASDEKYNRTELTKDRDRHDTLQEKEQEKWRQVGIYDDAANAPLGARVVDPRSPANATFVQSEETKRRYKAQADSFRNEAMTLQRTAKQIRSQHKWGEFAADKQGEQPAAQPVAAPVSSTGQSLYMAPGPADGLIAPGNIDLKQLPPVQLEGGKWGTVHSASREVNGKEILYPTIVNGKQLSDDEAFKYAMKTGKNLGVFKDGDAADKYAERLHSDWEAGKIPGVQMNKSNPAPKPVAAAPQNAYPAAVDAKGNRIKWNGNAWVPVPK